MIVEEKIMITLSRKELNIKTINSKNVVFEDTFEIVRKGKWALDKFKIKLNTGAVEMFSVVFMPHIKNDLQTLYLRREDKKGYSFFIDKKHIGDHRGKKYSKYINNEDVADIYNAIKNDIEKLNLYIRKEYKIKPKTREQLNIERHEEERKECERYLKGFINDDHDGGLLNVIFSMYFPYSNSVSIKVLPQMYNPFEEGYVNKLNETSLENFFTNAMDEFFDARQIYSTTRSMYLNRAYLTLVKKQKNKKCKYGFPIEVSLDDKNEYKYLGFIIEIEEQRIYISVPINLLLTKNNKYSYIQIMFNIDEMKFRIYTLDKTGRLFGYTTEDRKLATNEKSITLTAFKDDPNDPSDFDFYFLLDNTIDLYGVEDITRITR